jgi:hypothetical protein
MNKGDEAGAWAMVYLWMALIAVWFVVVCLAWYHIKERFL